MTTIITDIFGGSKRNFRALTAAGILLLTTGATSAQTANEPPAPVGLGLSAAAANPADAPADGNDEGESSGTFEFTSPVRAVTTARVGAGTGGSPVIYPASNTLAASTVYVPKGNEALTLNVQRTSATLPRAAKAGVGMLLAGGLLALGIAGVRAATHERARVRSLEA